MDQIRAIAIDPAFGYVYVGGYTNFIVEPYFPTTEGAFDETLNGAYDAFVSKLDNNLATLEASTFLGGSDSDERVEGLTLDGAGNVWVTGYTYSDDFPTTPGAYDDVTNFSNKDVFISKLDKDLETLMESTHIGGTDINVAMDIQVRSTVLELPGVEFPEVLDDRPTIYIAGYSKRGATPSSYYPTTPGAFDRVAHNYDVFVTVFGETLAETELITCTEKGEPKDLFACGDNVYVRGVGLHSSTDYTFYILPAGTAAESYDLAANAGLDPSGAQETNGTNGSGWLNPTLIWVVPPDYAGANDWQVVADNQGTGTSGVYHVASDAIDTTLSLAPLVTIPDVCLGSILLLLLN